MATTLCHFNFSSLGFQMDSINLGVTSFPLEADGGRAAEYARIVSVVSLGVVLAIGAAAVSTLRSTFWAGVDEPTPGD